MGKDIAAQFKTLIVFQALGHHKQNDLQTAKGQKKKVKRNSDYANTISRTTEIADEKIYVFVVPVNYVQFIVSDHINQVCSKTRKKSL